MPAGKTILLETPACEGCLVVVRLAASGAASLCGFETDKMEDAVAAVHESALLLLRCAGENARWRIEFDVGTVFRAALSVAPACCPSASAPGLSVAREVLLTLVDGVDFDREGQALTAIRLEKRP